MPIKIRERPIHGIDIDVVGNVISEIDLGRGKTGSEPDGVYAKVFQIVQLDVMPLRSPIPSSLLSAKLRG